RSSVEKLFSRIHQKFGLLHILVNSAAVNTADYLEDIKQPDLEKVIDVNIKGDVYTTIMAIPLMKKASYGRLIYINSGSGLKASAVMSLYSALKYFNRGFSISAALEVGKYNITSNSICPSDIYPEGEMGAKSWTTPSLIRVSAEKEGVDTLEELIAKRRSKNPMKSSCTTEDVADLAAFLASEKSGFINGQSLGLNGGAIPY
ncbi:MAG: SDR family NAD(P)-dependent oxidoreductase, partial [Spirochaetota bacterium]